MAHSLAELLSDFPPSHHAFHPTLVDGRYHYRHIGAGVRDDDRRGIFIILKPHPDGWIPDGRITLRKIEEKVSEIPRSPQAKHKPPFTAWTVNVTKQGADKLKKGIIPDPSDYKHDRLGYAYSHADMHGLNVHLVAYPFNGFVYIRKSDERLYTQTNRQ